MEWKNGNKTSPNLQRGGRDELDRVRDAIQFQPTRRWCKLGQLIHFSSEETVSSRSRQTINPVFWTSNKRLEIGNCLKISPSNTFPPFLAMSTLDISRYCWIQGYYRAKVFLIFRFREQFEQPYGKTCQHFYVLCWKTATIWGWNHWIRGYK